MPDHRTYVEPFGGGASVLLRKPPSETEIYNDLDDDVCNLFAVLRNPGQAQQLADLVELTPFARAEFFGAYADCADPVERARRLIVRAQMGFGSAGASKGITGFRATGGRQKNRETDLWSRQPERIQTVARRLKRVIIENRDALQVVRIIENRDALQVVRYYDEPDSLFFVDPPYLANTRNADTVGAYRHEMTDAQHIELLQLLNQCSGKILLTGYSHPIYDDLLNGWQKHTRQVQASGNRGGVTRQECLWINPAAQMRTNDLFGGVA